MQLDQLKMAEEQRVQGALVGEAERMQTTEAQGKDYVYKEKEKRELVELDRQQAKIDSIKGEVAAYQQARDGAIGSAISGLSNVAGAVGGLQAEKLAGGSGGSMFDGAKEKLKTSEDFKLDTKVDLSSLGYQGNKGKYKY
jgi:hypothetical protein